MTENPDLPEVGSEELTFAEITGDEQEAYAEPPERATAVEDFGTTADEALEGEDLEHRLRREQPDTFLGTTELPERDPGEGDPGEGEATGDTPYDTDDLVGRLVEPDEGARSDTEADSVGTDYGSDGGGFSAEEAAMHIDPDS